VGIVEVTVPDIGDIDEVGIIEVLVQPGDTIKAGQSLITVESGKASTQAFLYEKVHESGGGTLPVALQSQL